MKRTAKIWLITAGILVVLGPAIVVCAIATGGFDFSHFGSKSYEATYEEITSTFDQIAINTDVSDIEIATADEKQCKVEYAAPEGVEHSAEVQDDTLVVQSTDNRSWMKRISTLSFQGPKITLYLPESVYASMQIDIKTGDVVIPTDFSFDTLTVNGDTSDVKCAASVTDALTLKLTTGDVELNDVNAGQVNITTTTGDIDIDSMTSTGDISVTTNTGDVKLKNCTCKNFDADGDTGDVVLTDTIAEADFDIDTDTGDVVFERCDAAAITVNSTTGDITGTLLSDKVFSADTTGGDIDVPDSTMGGKCDLKTNAGDIQIKVTK